MNLVGKTREQIEQLVKGQSRRELIDHLFHHASLEPFFKISDVAKARRVSPDVIQRKIHAGEIAPVHKPLDNAYRIPLSAIRAWDEQTAIATHKKEG